MRGSRLSRCAATAFCVFALFRAGAAPASEKPVNTANDDFRKGLLGVTMNGAAMGLHGEWRFMREAGFRLTGIYFIGTEMIEGRPPFSPGEWTFIGVAGPVFYVPTRFRFIEPLVMAGLSYSYFHWERRWAGTIKHGIIEDLTCGWGAGVALRPADRVRIDATFWLNYDYTVRYRLNRKKKGDRMPLVMPFVSINILI